MKLFLAGALAMGFGIAGLFFLRFWRKTRDRLFALFALSFFVMALNRVVLAFVGAGPGGRPRPLARSHVLGAAHRLHPDPRRDPGQEPRPETLGSRSSVSEGLGTTPPPMARPSP